MNVIEWTAYNDSFILDTTIKCKSLKEAITQSHDFVKTQLKGEGTIKIYKNNELVRVDKKDRNKEYVTYRPRLTLINSNKWWDK